MTPKDLMSSNSFINALLPLGESLVKYSEQSHIPISIRSIEKGNRIDKMKILMHNKASGEVRGCSEGGHVGKTIPEVLEMLSMEVNTKQLELEQIQRNDEAAIIENCQKSHIQTTLDAKGFIRIFQRITTPIATAQNKISAVATVSLEVTSYTHLLNLLQLYKKYYIQHNNQTEAFQKFSSYLNLECYFLEKLNEVEITVLTAMVCDSRHQQIAQLISAFNQKNFSLKSVALQSQSIKEKLKPNLDIRMLLNDLRRHYQI